MPRFGDILTGRVDRQHQFDKSVVKKQRLAAATVWQTLDIYPFRAGERAWEKYWGLRGALLADDVGGGKTFESLAVIVKDFLETTQTNRERFRVLVIAAPAIRSKWEWQSPGNLKQGDETPATGLAQSRCDLETFLRQMKFPSAHSRTRALFESVEVVKRKKDWKKLQRSMPRQGIWLTSMQALPPTHGRKSRAVFQLAFPHRAFDWIIADEAHVVKSGYAQSEEEVGYLSGSAVRKLYAVLNSCPSARLIMLTATPFQNNAKELRQLISLVDHGTNGERLTDVITAGLDAFSKSLDEFTADPTSVDEKAILKLIDGLKNKIGSLGIENEPHMLVRPKALWLNGNRSGLDDYIRDVVVRNRKLHRATEPIQASLTEQGNLQYLLLRDLVHEEGTEHRTMVSQKLCELVSSPEAFRRKVKKTGSLGARSMMIKANQYRSIEELFGRNVLYDIKKGALIEFLKHFRPHQRKSVVVVYCRFIPTLESLHADLRLLKGKVVRDIVKMDGRDKLDERKKTLRKLADLNNSYVNHLPVIFLASQVANEGLDFDGFSNTVVHFDGHYNPAVIDQRNGRIYRGKNTLRRVRFHQILLKETYDQRIKFIELTKRKMKDFYLGDGPLEAIFETVLEENHEVKRRDLHKLLKFRIDLEPRRAWLLGAAKKQI
jgi:superfamily II DNA or RNA helicase